MAIKPILFNTEMVRAILDGRKSCTRRIVKPQQFVGMLPDKCKNGVPEEFLKEKKLMFKPYCDMTDIELINTTYKAPYQPGDILYVRETWGYPIALNSDKQYVFRADEVAESGFKNDSHIWHPSIHMPKEAARIWLKVTDVRVERLQEMTLKDFKAEGIYDEYKTYSETYTDHLRQVAYPKVFARLWNSTIKKSDLDKYGWDVNPWVWAIEFERCEKPEECE